MENMWECETEGGSEAEDTGYRWNLTSDLVDCMGSESDIVRSNICFCGLGPWPLQWKLMWDIFKVSIFKTKGWSVSNGIEFPGFHRKMAFKKVELNNIRW